MTNTSFSAILSLMHREIVPALGCTEPIAVALCAARTREKLGCEPDTIDCQLSANILKNAMGVGIPNTGMEGLPIAIALGTTIGHSEWQLEVLRETTPQAVEYAKAFLKRVKLSISVAQTDEVLYIHCTMTAGDRTASATIAGSHTHFVEEDEKDNSTLTEQEADNTVELNMLRVYDFAMKAPLDDLRFLDDAAKMDLSAAEYSFEGCWGHRLGRLIHEGKLDDLLGDTTFKHILSYTSGACDARMGGAMLPVMSNSGSGNQGISCTVPVAVYANDHHASDEQRLRALALSNLTVIYIKQSLGRLSALCGCVVAATGAACGITYLMGGSYNQISIAVKNMVANITGMICDGAKPSCAFKVTGGVATALLAASFAMNHRHCDCQEGITDDDVDQSIINLTRIGKEGMKQTDKVILDIMTK